MERRQIVNGKLGVLLINIFCKIMTVLGCIALVGSIIGFAMGTYELSKEKDEYVELIKNEDFEFSLSAVDNTKAEFLERIEDVDSHSRVVVTYVFAGLVAVLGIIMRLVLYVCGWVVTGSIIKDEDRPFTQDNLKVLRKSATILSVLYGLYFILLFFYDGSMFTHLGYLILLCIFVYLFDAGCKLQENVEKKQ